MKRTIIIDTDENRIELLRDGYNIVESSVYDKDTVAKAVEVLNEVLLSNIPY